MKLDRKTQKQIVKELKNYLGYFMSAQSDLNHDRFKKQHLLVDLH